MPISRTGGSPRRALRPWPAWSLGTGLIFCGEFLSRFAPCVPWRICTSSGPLLIQCRRLTRFKPRSRDRPPPARARFTSLEPSSGNPSDSVSLNRNLYANSNPVNAVDPTSYTYDEIGNADGTVASHTDFKGATRTFEYDAEKRVKRRIYPDGSQVSLSYTPTGQRASVTDVRGTTTYAYDRRDRLTEKTDPDGRRLTYSYDLGGNLAAMTVAVGTQVYTTAYTYDALSRLTTVTDSRGEVTTLGYDANGNRASLAYPNGLTTRYAYDALNRLTELSTRTMRDEIVQSHSYTLAASGNRARVDEHDGTSRHYIYDALHRLIQERVDNPQGEIAYRADLTLDPVGNRRQHTILDAGSTASIASTHDPRDRLLNAGSVSYGWDRNGNLIDRAGGGATTYSWDFDNRLVQATLADGTTAQHAYDADGHRVSTQTVTPSGATGTVEYLVDTRGRLGHVVAELVDGQIETLYTRAGEQLLSLHRVASGETRYAHEDGLGSIRLLSGSLGAPTDRYTYTAFGELLEHQGSDPNPYRFAGEAFEPTTGLYYNRARWLSPATGRFLSMDLVGPEMTLPTTVNRYAYALGDPVNVTDPTGLFPEWLTLILVGIQVHVEIGVHFFTNQVNRGRAPFTNRSITTILGIHHSACKPAGASCLVRPDLVSLHVTGLAEVYEIKTVREEAAGVAQLAGYLALLTANDRLGRAWVPGTTYVPQPTITVTAAGLIWPVRIFPPRNGMILYELGAVNPRMPVPFAVAAGVATAVTVVAMTGLTAAIKARTPAFAF